MLNLNRKGLPKEIKETKGREKNSYVSCKSDKREVTINSYVLSISSSVMRNVFLLQTTNPAYCVTQDDKKIKKSLFVTRYMTALKLKLTYPIKEWGHMLHNIKQENGH